MPETVIEEVSSYSSDYNNNSIISLHYYSSSIRYSSDNYNNNIIVLW